MTAQARLMRTTTMIGRRYASLAARLSGLRRQRLARSMGLPAFVIALAVVGFDACAANGLQLTDERGVIVRFAAVPARVVSMVPALTESVCELGQCERLVGVDRYSNWPASVARLPRLGGLDDVDVEAIVALRPDVVLLSRSSRVAGRLEGLGLKVVALELNTQNDLHRVLQSLGQVFGLPAQRADQLWQSINDAVDAQARRVPPHLRGLSVYFEVNRGPYAASAGSFIGQTLQRLGLRNIVPASLGPFPLLGPEFVVRADPDLVMTTNVFEPSLTQRPGWQAMRAVREGRVCTFAMPQVDVLVRPGPRIAEAAGYMVDCLLARVAGAPR